MRLILSCLCLGLRLLMGQTKEQTPVVGGRTAAEVTGGDAFAIIQHPEVWSWRKARKELARSGAAGKAGAGTPGRPPLSPR